MKQRPQMIGTLALISNVALVVLGNLVSNLVPATLPPIIRQNGGPILLTLALAELLVAVFLARLQSSYSGPTHERSKIRKRTRTSLLILSELLAAAGGIASNVAAAGLPASLRSYALPLFLGVTALAVAISLIVERLTSIPKVRATTRTNFLKYLQGLYTRQLEDTLRGAPLLAPRLSRASDVLDVGPSVSGSQIAVESTITKVFDTDNRRLLVVGEPGSGKTTLLVKLSLELLKRARDSEQSPIPVIFDLSTWSINKLTFAGWMMEELVERYQVAPDLARTWVATDAVILLADGLDELEGSASARSQESPRETCAHELNNFLLTHPHLPAVVCCRGMEYHELKTRLQISATVLVEPLTDKQIDVYLEQEGEQLRSLRALVAHDSDLRSLLRTPLFLGLIRLTALYLPTSSIRLASNQDNLRQQLLQDYASAMLERGRSLEQRSSYSPEEVARYLAWLAQQMKQHRLTVFSTSELYWSWLPNVRARRMCLALRWVGFAPVGLISGLLLGSVMGVLPRVLMRGLVWTGSFAPWIVLGLLVGMAGVLVVNLQSDANMLWGKSSLDTGQIGGIVGGLTGFFFTRGTALGLSTALIAGTISGLAVGAGGMLLRQILIYRAPISDRGNWTIRDLPVGLVGVSASTVLGGLTGGLAGGMADALYEWISGASAIAWTVAAIVLFGGLTLCSIAVFVAFDVLDGFGWSDINWDYGIALVTLGGLGFAAGSTIGGLHLYFGAIHGSAQQIQWIGGLIGALVPLMAVIGGVWSSMVVGPVFNALLAPVNKSISRATLSESLQQARVIPPHYDRFLQYAADHVLLQKTVSGYRFIHNVLRDFFAEQSMTG